MKYQLDVPVGWAATVDAGQRLCDVRDAFSKATEHGVPADATITVKKSPFGGISKLRFQWSA